MNINLGICVYMDVPTYRFDLVSEHIMKSFPEWADHLSQTVSGHRRVQINLSILRRDIDNNDDKQLRSKLQDLYNFLSHRFFYGDGASINPAELSLLMIEEDQSD